MREEQNEIRTIDSTEIEYDVDIQLAENENVDDQEAFVANEFDEKRKMLNKTKIVKQTWSILEIYQKLKDKKLLVDTKYQRNVIWDKGKQTAFIESLFMGIIIPPIYVVEIPGDDFLDQNKYEVVDGKQRVSTIKSFIGGTLSLRGKSLEYYRDWYGERTFNAIRESHKDEVNEMLSSVLDIYVITANSPESTKYDIFSRLNKGSEKLKVNEIRKAIYRSEILEHIEAYVEEHENDLLYKMLFSENDIRRYEDYGRFFRSIAFCVNSDLDKCEVIGYNSRPREMINDVLYRIQKGTLKLDKQQVDLIIERTIFLRRSFTGDPNSLYLIDACIPYALKYWERLETNIDAIKSDSNILFTMEKSPSTTKNVNQRLKRIGEIIFDLG